MNAQSREEAVKAITHRSHLERLAQSKQKAIERRKREMEKARQRGRSDQADALVVGHGRTGGCILRSVTSGMPNGMP